MVVLPMIGRLSSETDAAYNARDARDVGDDANDDVSDDLYDTHRSSCG